MADTVLAPAKVNLYLHVTGRREDGFHLLDSLVVFAGSGDGVSAEPADDLSLEITGPFGAGLPTGPENLVLGAAMALREAAGIAKGARLTLDKRLPVAAGIGGGSADAAAALKALVALWEIDQASLDLPALALGLGADVPVCLEGRPVFMSGIGEVLTPAPRLPASWLVLVNPGVPVATPAVFKARRGGFSQPAPFAEPPRDVAALAALLEPRTNDLMAPAVEIAPEVGEVLGALTAIPDCRLARMSGSGATCFGLFDGEPGALAAAERLRGAHGSWWISPAPILG